MSDTQKDLNCPACQKKMAKVFIPHKGINIDICLEGCGGMWFDNREFKCFDEQEEKIEELLDAINNKTFSPVDEKAQRICPVCKAKMVKNFSSIKKEIQIDECYSCGGRFLDNSELIKFRDEYKNDKERSNDTVNFMYSAVGFELKQLDKKLEQNEKNRSMMKRVFDKLFLD